MSSLIDAARNGVKLLQRNDDDNYDRLSSRYSVAICLVFSILISGGMYIGDPISCWMPAHYTGQWVRFTEQLCWVKNTYYVPLSQSIPAQAERTGTEVAYYQWAPIILAFQALLFSLPMLIWKIFSKESGYDVHQIVTTCRSPELLNPQKRMAVIQYLTMHLDRLLVYRHEYGEDVPVSRFRWLCKRKCGPCGKRYGNYMLALYFTIKCLYIAIAVAQLLALNWIVVGSGPSWYGLNAYDDLIERSGWGESPFFPRVTLCGFQIRGIGYHIQSNVVQCVLPYNAFNEKIFIFMWWWLLFVCIMSTVGLLGWVLDVMTNRNIKLVTDYLCAMSYLSREDEVKERRAIEMFVTSYLRRDGVFVLRMVARHVSDMTTAELVCSLYDNFAHNLTGEDRV